MLENIAQKIIKRMGVSKAVQMVSLIFAVAALIVFILEMFIPVKQGEFESQAFSSGQNSVSQRSLNEMEASQVNINELLRTVRGDLFKSASGLDDNPMADKTIQRIKSQLKLQCIVKAGEQLNAYIKIKDVGLKRCSVGDKVNDMFTVMDINVKTVEISIIDHRVMLSL